jgi:hypothetical protein
MASVFERIFSSISARAADPAESFQLFLGLVLQPCSALDQQSQARCHRTPNRHKQKTS